MGQIYRAASGVVVWLGEESDGSSAAMQLPRRIRKYWPSLYDNPRELLQSNKTPDNIDRWQTGVWTAFMSLLERPWWRRIWAIQEVVCAREIILTCGTATAVWDDFVKLVQVIDAIRHPVNTPSPGTRTTAQRVAFMQELRSITEQGTTQAMTDYADKDSLALNILSMAKDCEATDHRDKLFACHHLVRLWDRPDYGMPIEMLYKRFALKYLSRLAEAITEPSCDEKTLFRRQVELVYTAGTCNQNLDLPSWVPDWSVPWRTRPLWYENECYSAGGHEIKEIIATVVERRPHEFNFRLPVTTKVFDRVLAAGTDAIQVTSSDPSDLFVDLRAWLFQSMSLLHMHRNRSSPYTDLTTAIARTITVDQDDGHRLSPEEAVSRYEALLEMLRLSKAEPSSPIDNESQSTYHSVAAFLRGRVVFVTERGYIGLAQVGVAWGDTIAVMQGAPVPIVLRPTLETGPKVREYRMLCEAFVANDEVMYGGFWEGDVPGEDIALVTLLGADGKLGPSIYEALVSAGFTVTVLKRDSSKSKTSYPSQVSIPDAFNVEDLVEVLRGQDAIVVTIKGSETELQKRIADACVKAGVKRFIPADFGSVDSSSALTQELVPLYKHKTALREYLIELAQKHSSFTWTSLVCGHFFDQSLEFLHIYLPQRRIEIINDGSQKWSASSLAQIALATVRILQRPDVTANRMIYIQSFLVSQNEVTAAFERATGGAKWEVVSKDSEKYREEEKIKADAGDKEAVENLVWLLGAIDADWTGKKDFAMEELGLEEEDLDEVVRATVKRLEG
ncbi:unnamed protein product [Zymoseptoria tritici ST99CH_1A5]|uniref:NmrA-like domain-containing protein n=1 Tax=Zymoseptoria tritici ST99CH_1A5 TaxID=1276529 RepID=A0A1Y6LCG6_ZYMTR|nr:unnamed protein product [Zymoseptoria tritici ST99CH_1A5]